MTPRSSEPLERTALTPAQVDAADAVLRAARELERAPMVLAELTDPAQAEAELELAAYLAATKRPHLRVIPGGLSAVVLGRLARVRDLVDDLGDG
jgi:hypothetical protein